MDDINKEAAVDQARRPDAGDIDAVSPIQVTGDIWAALAQTADSLSLHLPKLLNSYNPTDPTIVQVSEEIAAGMYKLQDSAKLPGGRPTDEDLREINSALKDWITGSISTLPRAQPVPERRAAKVTGIKTRRLRQLLLAVIPLAVLFLVQFLPIKGNAVNQTLGAFAATWLITTILAAFAPHETQAYLETKPKPAPAPWAS